MTRAANAASVMAAVLIALGSLLGSCWSARFVRTDPQYADRPAATMPEVFAERKPERRFRAVGFIHVEADAAISEKTIRSLAAEEGRKAGCEVLVDRRLESSAMFENLRLAVGATVLLAHEGDERTSSGSTNSGSSETGGNGGWQRREFICGIFVDRVP